MREIKFRVWDKINHEWLEYVNRQLGWLCPAGGDCKPLNAWVYQSPGGGAYNELQYCLDHPEAFVVCQYAGLKDKNGREVCEGDIVRLTGKTFYTNEFFSDENGTWELIGELTFDSFMWVVDDEMSLFPLSEIVNDPKYEIVKDSDIHIEKIGDIYSTPELLGAKGEVSNGSR